MITRAKSNIIFNKIVSKYAYFFPVMSTAHSLYSSKPSSMAEFYLQGRSAAIMIMGKNAMICGTVKNPDELCSFFTFIGVTHVKSNGYVPFGYEAKGLCIMTYQNPIAKSLPKHCILNCEPSLYNLAYSTCITNTEVIPDDYYSDTCIRRAHGFADVLTLENKKGDILSTAGVYGISDTEAYIAVVSTPILYRGRGYASYLIYKLCQRHLDKRITLLCTPEMKSFYEEIGFAQSDVVISAKINNR